MTKPRKPTRVPLMPVDEAKAAADEAGVPDYMAELSIFQVLLNHPRLARTFNDMLATMLVARRARPAVARVGDYADRLADRMRLRVDAALARRFGTRHIR